MAFYTGSSGPCAWSHVRGRFGEAEATGFFTHLRKVVAEATPGQLVLDITYDIPMPTAVQRQEIASILASASDLSHLGGHALVVNSPVGRHVLTAINWISPPPFEERVFVNPAEAIRWLVERNPRLDTEHLYAQIRERCPGFDDLRW